MRWARQCIHKNILEENSKREKEEEDARESAAGKSGDQVEHAARDPNQAVSTSTSAPPSRKERRVGLNNPPHGHYAAPTTFSVQPNAMQFVFPPCFPAHPSHPPPLFSPSTFPPTLSASLNAVSTYDNPSATLYRILLSSSISVRTRTTVSSVVSSIASNATVFVE